ncbi:MAG: hypothetical protein V4503_01350 [Gemmatimonadota bacterium]
MTDRRYTDDEVAAIFERAAKADSSKALVRPDASGLTLAALHEIGREAGISPEAISEAARSLGAASRPTAERFLGLPLGVADRAEFDYQLTDLEWQELVGELRDTFLAKGRVREDGAFREWSNGNLHALVEPTANGFRLKLRTRKGNSQALMIGGGAMLGVSLVTALTSGLAGTADVRGVTFMAVIGVGAFAFGALRLVGWARQRREQFQRILASVARREPDAG